jgi:PKD repeat protein
LIFRKKRQKTNGYHKTAASIFLMAVLALAVATLSMGSPNTEAQSSSDFCERFGFFCEEEPTPDPTPTDLTAEISSSATSGDAPLTIEFDATITGGTEPYTISWDLDGDGSEDSDEQSAVHTYEDPGTYTATFTVTDSEGQTVTDSMEITVTETDPEPEPALNGGTDFTRQIWTTTRSTAAQRDLSNQILDSGDMIVFHYPIGRDPTSTHISHLKGVSTVPDSNKGFEFFSLAEIQEHAQTVADNGFGFIAYNLEHGQGVDDEANNPVEAFTDAKAAADAAGIELHAVPERGISIGSSADEIAPLVDALHYQVQSLQDRDTACITARDSVRTTKNVWEGANSELNDNISYQLSFSRPAAAGKTVLQTINDCTTRISGTVTTIDGMSPWWTGPSFDSGDCRRALVHHENGFS